MITRRSFLAGLAALTALAAPVVVKVSSLLGLRQIDEFVVDVVVEGDTIAAADLKRKFMAALFSHPDLAAEVRRPVHPGKGWTYQASPDKYQVRIVGPDGKPKAVTIV